MGQQPNMPTPAPKRCFKCGADKPISEFYKHPQMADGHLNKCKACTRSDVRRNRRKRLEQYRQYDRDRYANDPRVKARIARTAAEWRANHPAARKAHRAVAHAKRTGRLKEQPCEQCGATDNIHAHHHDYSRPLDVQWLCAACHRQHHMQAADAAGEVDDA